MRKQITDALTLLHTGEPQRVEEAIRLLQGTVFAFSLKVCGHREDAEDTMQEVLMRSLPHLARIQDAKALSVWLYTVTRNRCWRSRHKRVAGPTSTLSMDELVPDEPELQRILEDGSANPEEQAMQEEYEALLHRAVLSLPAPYRLVLVLHDMEELETEQVATVLGLRAGTVRVRLHRARLAMRKNLLKLLGNVPVQETTAEGAELHAKRPGRRRKRTAKTDRPADCKKIFANLSEYIDQRLDPANCKQMQRHIEACPACVAFIRELRAAIDRCRSFDPVCDAAVSERLTRLLLDEYVRLFGQTA